MHVLENAPEFKRLKIQLLPVYLGVEIPQRASGGILARTMPQVYRDVFGTFEEFVRACQRRYHGAALLYGLQSSGREFGSPEALLALMAGAPTMPIFFQYTSRMAEVVPSGDYDRLLVELSSQMTGRKELLFWCIAHGHLTWSADLSRIMIDRLDQNGPDTRWSIWSYGGNCFADSMHSSLIEEARRALKPFAKTSALAKRWNRKLRERLKA